MKLQKTNRSFLDALNLILKETTLSAEIEMNQIISILAGKGYAALLVIFTLPFCFPIQIPGFSTPFGITLALLGLRIGLGMQPWWPQFILTKKLSSKTIKKIAENTIGVVTKLRRITHPRLFFFTKNPICHRINGFLISVLSIFLSLPLPLPFTNLVSALPIFFIGIGLLEDDGLFIIIGYFLSLICFAYFIALYFFGAYLIDLVM